MNRAGSRLLGGLQSAFLVATIVVQASVARALEPDRALTQYGVQAWARAEGLPQSTVSEVLAARDGYLWVATQEGLMRFDGARFVRFGPNEDPAFRSGFVTALAEGTEGLWIGTLDGVVLKEGRSFRAFGAREGLGKPHVRSLVVSREGRVWVGTEGGLQRLEQGRFSPTAVPEPPAAVNAVAEDADGTLWVAAEERLYAVAPTGPVALAEPLVLPGLILALEPVPGGGILAGGGWGLRRVGGPGRVVESYPLPGDVRPGVSSLHFDPSGALFVGTQVDGLLRVADGRVERISKGEGLPSGSVFAIAEDPEGSLWLGLDRGGLVRLSAGAFRTYGALEGLDVESTFGVHGAPDGALWVTSDLGLSRIGPDGSIETFRGPPPAGPGPFASALDVAPDGDLIVGSFSRGLFAGRPGSLRTLADGARAVSVRALLRADDGVLWIGGAQGLFRLETGGIRRLPDLEGPVYALAKGDGGALFAGTGHGLVSVSREGRIRRLPLDSGPEERRLVVSICRDAEGRVWIGTIGAGLGLLDGARVRTIRSRDGLPGDSVYGVVEDAGGSLWLSSNEGVFRLAAEEALGFLAGRSRRVSGELFGRTDGLRNPECMGGVQPPAWRGADGRLWFAVLGGVAVVDPSRVKGTPQTPRVVVEEVRVDGQRWPPDARIEAPPGRGRLEVTYAGLSLLAPDRLAFRYRLSGFDTEWTEVGARREAFFTNVPPGRYVFEVSARLGNGAWSEPPAGVPLTLRARFWETRAFRVAALVSVVLGFAAILRWRTRSLRRRQAQLERVVEERTRKLRDANDRLGELNAELERLSQVDALTGVANRRVFDGRLEAEWRRAARSGQSLSLGILDVDHFKSFNDGYGHPAGDDCLRSVARCLSEATRRPGDVVARYGGEEFVVLLPGLEESAAGAFVEGLRRRVEALGLPHAFSPVSDRVTVSAGVAAARPGDAFTAADLVASADAALYRAKGSGRNRVRLASEPA